MAHEQRRRCIFLQLFDILLCAVFNRDLYKLYGLTGFQVQFLLLVGYHRNSESDP